MQFLSPQHRLQSFKIIEFEDMDDECITIVAVYKLFEKKKKKNDRIKK